MRAIVLALCLAGLPVADDDPAKNSSTSSSTEKPPIVRFSEPATPQGSTSTPSTSTSEPGAEASPKSPASEPSKKPTSAKKLELVPESKKVIDEVREETSEMLEQVRNVISGMEKGDTTLPDVTIMPPPKNEEGKGCDVDVPRVLAFELERIRAIRDETQIMLDLHDKNVVDIETKLSELEAARQKLDRARSALEETLTRKSKIDDDKEKERRRIRLLLSSGQMKPKKIAALMEQISVEESRVLLEALPEATAKAVLEALPADRLALIVGQGRASTKAPETGATP
jgi:hypothetical protein